ncbi:hypothetical protein ACFFMR_30940 [Micromonospora andamanensis]|uniref:Uncharacterized protein n=1 Tax=Micromonospora andamanensis TaxID=1287068 RepID=A0ABQ4I4B4_9ACTN|nr:hypothetical protein [Micromonospora andamanensis]GIJ12727.1 hypothetical protein Van01_59410 [Micromonospora andamanensis]
MATRDAAPGPVRVGLADPLAAHGVHAALVDGLGRAAPGSATGVRVKLPAEGWIVCDTAPLAGLLDGDPAICPPR